ncbi:hypothetical protein, partial [Pseudomonas maioricensis]|uniref:hypothetical protein n=1 Tax=Pseudomonas maioricensis TaxID=1766623 RepID=UPI001FACD868
MICGYGKSVGAQLACDKNTAVSKQDRIIVHREQARLLQRQRYSVTPAGPAGRGSSLQANIADTIFSYPESVGAKLARDKNTEVSSKTVSAFIASKLG